MSNELLPCPFCGAPGEHDSHDMRDLVFCSNPKCDWAHNHGIRTATWNTRPEQPAVTALRECMASIETLGFSGDIAHGVWARWQDIVGKETP